MTESFEKPDERNPELAEQVDFLAEQVKTLALNLAINLARAKNQAQELTFMEKDFTRLINGSVEVIREIMAILRVFRNQEKMVYDPPSKSGQTDRIEKSLNEILSLSHEIQEVIAGIKNKKKQVDNYS
jgi:hypothetical protein